jgi:glycosyltransferase involved in cell wall biosynthesis
LDSVLAQTYQNWECIVVDDGSTDNTAEILEKYIKKDVRFQYHRRPEDRPAGGNAARNYGFELSKGTYIQWFDDDDVMLPDFLKRKQELFSEMIDLVVCSGFYTDQNLKLLEQVPLMEHKYLYRDYMLWDLKILTPSVLFKKKFLEAKMLFTLMIQRGQEKELFSRLFFQLPNTSYKIINEPLFLYRQHEKTKSTKNKTYTNEFVASKIYIAAENLKRSILLKDNKLVNHFSKALVNYFFRALKYGDKKNARMVLKQYPPIIGKKNLFYATQFKLMGEIIYSTGLKSYTLEKYFKKHKFVF